jgi:hypothetical protein
MRPKAEALGYLFVLVLWLGLKPVPFKTEAEICPFKVEAEAACDAVSGCGVLTHSLIANGLLPGTIIQSLLG